MIVIGLTGMPAAGKSTTARILDGRHVRRVNISDIISENLKAHGLPPTGGSYEKVAAILRRTHGEGFFAEEVCRRLSEAVGASVFCIDGIRTSAEVTVIRRNVGTFILVALWASFRTRLTRALSPGPHVVMVSSEEEFRLRDERNIELGVGTTVVSADVLLQNDVDGIETLTEEVGRKLCGFLGATSPIGCDV